MVVTALLLTQSRVKNTVRPCIADRITEAIRSSLIIHCYTVSACNYAPLRMDRVKAQHLSTSNESNCGVAHQCHAQLYYAIHNVQQHAGGGGVNVCQYAWQVHREPELQCSKVEHQGVITANWLQINSISISGEKYLPCVFMSAWARTRVLIFCF